MSGYQHAPLTKLLTFATGSTTLLSSIYGVKGLELPSLAALADGHIWKIFTHQWAFSSPGEAVIGLMLLHNFRIFERQMGTRKYSVFVLWAYGLAALTHLACLVLAPSWRPPQGPYALIFASLIPYVVNIPSAYRFRLCGVPFSDKLFVYLLSAQLAFQNFPHAFVGIIGGLVAGLSYHSTTFPIRKWLIPLSLSRLGTKWFLPWLDPTPKQNTAPFGGAGVRIGAPMPRNAAGMHPFGGAAGGFPAGGQQQQPYIPQVAAQADPEAVNRLVEMGFNPIDAETALRQTGNDFASACELLLRSM
eukprot:TRINITY_DN4065_c0_g1_i3.p1 TRINITY_DN4065_c0_g1~~TRINITY_DN4065_c0_g1_i3.p1  ORF type:complete len:317 (+),score=31.30 TRINITY_DN4065_c0_g1_i3:44-952(+)